MKIILKKIFTNILLVVTSAMGVGVANSVFATPIFNYSTYEQSANLTIESPDGFDDIWTNVSKTFMTSNFWNITSVVTKSRLGNDKLHIVGSAQHFDGVNTVTTVVCFNILGQTVPCNSPQVIVRKKSETKVPFGGGSIFNFDVTVDGGNYDGGSHTLVRSDYNPTAHGEDFFDLIHWSLTFNVDEKFLQHDITDYAFTLGARHYTTLPEPPLVPLLGIAIIGLAVHLRKRKKA